MLRIAGAKACGERLPVGHEGQRQIGCRVLTGVLCALQSKLPGAGLPTCKQRVSALRNGSSVCRISLWQNGSRTAREGSVSHSCLT